MTCAYGSQPADEFYNFNNNTQYEEQAERILNELKKKGVKTIALLISNNIGSTQQADVLEKKLLKTAILKSLPKRSLMLVLKILVC